MLGMSADQEGSNVLLPFNLGPDEIIKIRGDVTFMFITATEPRHCFNTRLGALKNPSDKDLIVLLLTYVRP